MINHPSRRPHHDGDDDDGRSRDNFPNPVTEANPYVPLNSPALSDLLDFFDFDDGGHPHHHHHDGDGGWDD
jgi:phospholipase C